MSMTTHVYGIIPDNNTYNKMISAFKACKEAGVSIPPEVLRFMNCQQNPDNPEQKGILWSLDGDDSVTKYSGDMEEGFEVELAKLTDGIKFIRFVNSW